MLTLIYFNNNNNQAFYSYASWGRVEMKSHEQTKKNKTRAKKDKLFQQNKN
jgi:hypothetical protein